MGFDRRLITLSLFSALFFCPAVTFASEIPSLQVWLKPENLKKYKTGDCITLWVDSSLKKNDGSNPDVEFCPRAVESAIENFSSAKFDGVGTLLNFPQNSILENVTDFAFFFVVKSTVKKSGYETFFGAGERGDNPQLGLNSGLMTFFSSQLSPTTVQGKLSLTPGKWSVLEYHKEIENINFLADGENAGGMAFLNPSSEILSSFRGLGCGGGQDECFMGEMAEVLIYDRALSNSEQNGIRCELAKKYRLSVKGC